MNATSWALVLAVLGATVVWISRQGTARGALAGLAVAVIAILGLGPGTLLPLAVFVLGAGALTRLGRDAKERAGTAEPDQGRRGEAHVAAKLGLPFLLSAVALAVDPAAGTFLRIGFAASLGAAFADTAATEIGPLARGGAVALPSFRGVPHGTPGGVSLAGLAASLAGASACAVASAVSGLVPPAAWLHVAGAGFAATLFESVLGPTPPGRALGHHGRNAAASVVAAALACGAWTLTLARSGPAS
ncbi:MAG TPA: DUF92 domain-containing protein [Candidatus Eisenbacteria bacterium]|nr:DUF92 domain-containing protein [Candidatus Eisenbacteria bacterium]